MKMLCNESLIVQEMQAGSEDAFAMLYRHYSPQLYQNIFRMTRDPLVAEEFVQELFTRIWQKKECVGIKENFSGYLYRVAQHLVHDFFRKLKKDKKLFEKFSLMAQENYSPIEFNLQQQQSSVILNNAIEQLPPQQKRAYRLVRENGCSYKKAAEYMGISPLTVKEYLAAAKISIRKYILGHVDSPQELLFFALIYISIL